MDAAKAIQSTIGHTIDPQLAGEISSKDRREALTRTTQTLLNPLSEPGALNCAVGDLYDLCSQITGIDAINELPENVTDTLLEHGLALSPRGAGRCLFHFERTAKFLRGMQAAILEAQKRFPGETIHVLYAGCGPYAALAAPLSTIFSAEQVQFTLLDIHRQSLDAVQKLIDALEISAYIRDLIECDATKYRHPAKSPIHIVATETMQKALALEPQVAITLNLARQLCAGGIMVPEKIALNICIAEIENGVVKIPAANVLSEGAGSQPQYTWNDLGTVFEITSEIASQAPWNDGVFERFSFPAVKLRMPEPVNDNKKLTILTDITIFQTITLVAGDSWLALPTPLLELTDIEEGTEIEFFYSLDQYPQLNYRFL